MKLLFAFALPLLLLAAPASAETASLDDLDCSVRVMKVLSGSINELKKTTLTPAEREESVNLKSRADRALAYFTGRIDIGPKIPSLNNEIAKRWDAAGKLDIDTQTNQTIQCLDRADDNQMAFLKSAAGE
jgi:hypothetical protein